MSELRVSVVIPVFNEEAYIGRCLDALMKQTLQPNEIVIVDNNSTDKSAEIASAYRGARVVRAESQGIMPARNVGYDEARGDIVARIDADTITEPEWLERMVRAFDDSAVLAVSSPTWFYETKLPGLSHWLLNVFYFDWNRIVCGVRPLFGSDMAFRRSIWKEVQAQQHIHTNVWEDLDFAMFLKTGKRQLEMPSCAVSMRSADDTLIGVTRYMWRWPMTYYHRRHWRGLVGSLVGLGFLVLFAPGVLLATSRR